MSEREITLGPVDQKLLENAALCYGLSTEALILEALGLVVGYACASEAEKDIYDEKAEMLPDADGTEDPRYQNGMMRVAFQAAGLESVTHVVNLPGYIESVLRSDEVGSLGVSGDTIEQRATKIVIDFLDTVAKTDPLVLHPDF